GTHLSERPRDFLFHLRFCVLRTVRQYSSLDAPKCAVAETSVSGFADPVRFAIRLPLTVRFSASVSTLAVWFVAFVVRIVVVVSIVLRLRSGRLHGTVVRGLRIHAQRLLAGELICRGEWNKASGWGEHAEHVGFGRVVGIQATVFADF